MSKQVIKKYLFNGKNFELKTSFNLNELDELNEMSKSLFPASSNMIQGNFTKGTLKRFLQLVLKPLDEVDQEFYGQVDEMQFAEIFKDFFLSRIGLIKSTQNSS